MLYIELLQIKEELEDKANNHYFKSSVAFSLNKLLTY
jgi:hypothetical protein